MTRVERLALTRKLSFAQLAEVLDALSAAGISVESPATREFEGSKTDEVEVVDDTVDVVVDEETWYRRLLDHSLLNAQRERELGRTIALGAQAEEERVRGDSSDRVTEALKRASEARDLMARSNFRLVWPWARRYAAMTGLDVIDLFQDGNIGLLRAIDKYDPDEGTRFSTYATWWIRQAVGRAVADRGRSIRLPIHIHDNVLKLARATRLLWRENGSRPNVRQLSDELGWDLERVAFLQAVASLVPISFEDSARDEEGFALHEKVSDGAQGPQESLERAQDAAIVHEAISRLPARMRAIITLRNGIGGGPPETLESIGRSYGLTRERVRQLESKGMERLKRILSAMSDPRLDRQSGFDA